MSLPTEIKALNMAGYGFEDVGTCSGCGAEIEWWKTPRGKKMPISVVPVYRVEGDPTSTLLRHDRIPHFANCPKVKDFRKKK
ncbi:MAG TPA: hypothetical protein VN976_22075 [Verrucomicrobiae bacterium]|nr:hypothetical protein [Verrucomicrobiae bacterium]